LFFVKKSGWGLLQIAHRLTGSAAGIEYAGFAGCHAGLAGTLITRTGSSRRYATGYTHLHHYRQVDNGFFLNRKFLDGSLFHCNGFLIFTIGMNGCSIYEIKPLPRQQFVKTCHPAQGYNGMGCTKNDVADQVSISLTII
jgi:hypothetical protein